MKLRIKSGLIHQFRLAISHSKIMAAHPVSLTRPSACRNKIAPLIPLTEINGREGTSVTSFAVKRRLAMKINCVGLLAVRRSKHGSLRFVDVSALPCDT